MAEMNRSTRVVAFDADKFHESTLELDGCMAQLRMVATVAAHGALDELPDHTVSTYLINLEERFGATIRQMVNRGELQMGERMV